MLNKKIEVFGRIKPASSNSQIKEYDVENGANEDTLKFCDEKFSSGRKTFRFKRVFCPGISSQEDVFEAAAKPIIENVLTGYNGTIFAYGQTGTGKTYTMNGDFTVYKDRGIIPRTIQFLFHSLSKTSKVAISYFEIYNEHGYDLIGYQPTSNTVELQQVNVLEDSKGNLHFRNLSAHNVNTVQEALDLLLFGDGNRMVAETINNLRSSRSHTIFLVTLETMVGESSFRSTLHLVDLAGSERLGKGTLLYNSWESRYINLSLHYLEQVLVALGEPGRLHIPYRNSLMTTVLKNSLGGNCCTAMIATFSCDPKDFEETLQTCRFSQRVALVRNEAKINDITDINTELVLLRKENAYLKDQLRELQGQQSSSNKSSEELLEKDKNDCYERVKDFIADSDFMNLPLTDSKKAEYCFRLMRNEIIKLKPEAKHTDFTDDFNSLSALKKMEIHNPTDFNSKKPSRNFFSEVGNATGNSKKRAEVIMRKRRVIMDIPKINVIYKKYKSTETVPSTTHMGTNTKSSKEGNYSQPSAKEYEKHPHPGKISQSCQTSTTMLSLNQTEFICHTIKTDSMIIADEDIEKNRLERIAERKNEIYSRNRVPLYDVQSLPASMTDIGDPDDDEDVDDDDDDDDDDEDLQDFERELLKKTLSSPGESDRESRFSTTGLPLTGDGEIDEEIIKFYSARYKKFKRKD